MMDRRVCIKEFFIKEYCDREEVSCQVSLGSTGNAEMMRQYMSKFMKEAKTIARLNHPNIISIFDVFEENNTAYYVMEYIPGSSLGEWVRKSGPLPEDRALSAIRQIGAALSYAHGHRVMHLDVKPSNIMMDGDRAVLIDFGLSKQYAETGEQTSSTPVGISHGYAPLEQYQEGGVKEFSPATDVYSMGATLYKLLTGQTPPPAPTVVQSGMPDIPGTLSAPVRKAIEQAMSFRKKDRPQSVDAFLDILSQEPEEPVGAGAPPVPETDADQDLIPDDEVTVVSGSEKGPSLSEKKTSDDTIQRFHPLTAAYLYLGLVICVCVSVMMLVAAVAYLIEGDTEGFTLLILTIASAAACVGLGYILQKHRKAGVWLFMISAAVCAVWGAIYFAEESVYIALLILYALTFAVLLIKNDKKISGWKLLS